MTYPLIGMMGQKRSGKDTFASFLTAEHGYTRFAFADPMKNAAYALDPLVKGTSRLSDIVDLIGWEGAKEYPEVRRTLQRLGTEVGRNIFGENFWVDATMNNVTPERRWYPVVITDVRFPNEADAIRAAHGILVRVDRPGLPDEDGHVSEHAWRTIKPDYIVNNTGTVDDVRREVATFVTRM